MFQFQYDYVEGDADADVEDEDEESEGEEEEEETRSIKLKRREEELAKISTGIGKVMRQAVYKVSSLFSLLITYSKVLYRHHFTLYTFILTVYDIRNSIVMSALKKKSEGLSHHFLSN